MKIIYLISPEILKQFTGIHTNVDEKLIYPEIKAQQDIYIKKVLGSSLFDKILDGIDSDNLAGDYLFLQKNYIIPCLCNYVLAELPESLNYQFWNRGLVQNNSTTVNNITPTEMFSIMSKYKSRAEYYASEMTRHILANKNKYPEYLQEVSAGGTKPDEDNYECAIFI